MMRPRALATRRLGFGLVVVGAVAACSKANKSSDSEPQPSAPMATATASATSAPEPAPAPPPVFDSPQATPTAVPSAPVVVVPPEESGNGLAAKPKVAPAARPVPTTAPPSPPRAMKPSKPDADDGLHATPAPSLGVKKVAVSANNHFTCSSTEKRDNVAAVSEPRGARISIMGQGPCAGEVHDWNAQVSERRVEVNGTHGAVSKCRCMGTGELVLRGLEPGTYDVAVNGGFDRPIAARITVSQ